MTLNEEINEVIKIMETADIKNATDEQLVDLFEIWAYQVSEGYLIDTIQSVRYYEKCKTELLRRLSEREEMRFYYPY